MLLYVMALVLGIAAMFDYGLQDRYAYQDPGEMEAAGWMLGRHGMIEKACSDQAMACDSKSGAVALVPSASVVTKYQARYANAAANGRWDGVRTVSVGELLVTYYDTGTNAGAKSLGANLSLARISARLNDMSGDFVQGTDFYTGYYNASDKSLHLGRGTGVGIVTSTGTQVKDSSGVLISTIIPINVAGVATIADGSPVIVSIVVCQNGTGYCPTSTSIQFDPGVGLPTTRQAAMPDVGGKIQTPVFMQHKILGPYANDVANVTADCVPGTFVPQATTASASTGYDPNAIN